MSLVTATLAMVICLCIGLVDALETLKEDDSYNYANHGTDWTMGNCGDRTDDTFSVQSPWAFNTTAADRNWNTLGSFSALTSF